MRKILLALHGGPTAEGAIRIARLLGDRTGAIIDAVAVLEPLPVLDYGYGPVYIPDAETEDALAETLRKDVKEQLRRAGLGNARLSILRGQRVASIVSAAAARQADLIVAGIGPHHFTDRALGGETALQLAQQASTPILAVPAQMSAFPHRILAAVDFSPASVAALRVALSMLGGGERVELVHVAAAAQIGSVQLGPTHPNNARRRLEDFVSEIEVPAHTRTVASVFAGDPARTLLDAAAQSGAELIVLGSHGYGPWQRLMLGSVSSKVLRLATCAVLVYPARCLTASGASERRLAAAEA